MSTFDLASLRPLFAPRSVAMIGASNDENKVGGRPLAFLKRAGFGGTLVPVHPAADTVQGLPVFRTLAAAGPVEHAIIALAARDVLPAFRDCAAKGVKAVQVFSSGFADAGRMAEQDELLRTAREAGMRMIGPNSLGLFNAVDGFFGTFATALDGAWPALRRDGNNIGLASQSGAFGSYCYGLAQARGLGFSHMIATGNEADVDVAECIAYLAQDNATRVIVATFEGCRSGDRLIEALRLARAAGKPVLVMKAGASAAGAQAAATHTGALAGNDAVFDGILRQYGAWRAQTLDGLIDVAYALCVDRRRDLRREDGRLAVLTTSGGVGVLIADAASAAGLQLPGLPAAARAEMSEWLPAATASNPLDTSTSVLGDMALVARAMGLLVEQVRPGTVLAFLAHVGRNPVHWAQLRGPLLALVAAQPGTRFILSMLAPPTVREELEQHGVALFEAPERAVAAIQAVTRIGAAVSDVVRRPRSLGPARRGSGTVLDEARSKAVLAAAGIAVPAERVTRSAAAAQTAAVELGAPRYALKIVSADILHKTEAGGVVLDVAAKDVGPCWETVVATVRGKLPQARIDGVLVTPMARPGIDAILSAQFDPVFGMVVMFGLGGTWVEVFRDVVFRAAPFDAAEARRMIEQTRVADLLGGVRGSAAIRIEEVAAAIASFSDHVAARAGEIESIEVNPWRLHAEGGVALDAVVVQRKSEPEGVDA
ncbi:succinyl-CoA synthetase subunit alpha [Variovorax sp. SRS16]|uniref:acetate--CoA ligase family protein n=1 Tax=Variovorax sp. SRS16 TaxID=282217 RepID=UPI0013169E61|nr:acetate--CoA ligase family protein [Variovorax sp. SRS16]VTU33258.1 succinyl-CoA synthetase subunit alpha [Variovorax sp. SRS16]